MNKQSGIRHIAAMGIALCVIFVTLVVARSPIASAGSFQGTIVPSPNATGAAAWSIVTSANTSTAATNYLYGVTCVSSSDCWAVGYSPNNGNISQTLVEQWNGTSWSIVSSPNTSTTQSNGLQGVTCVSSSDCWAVGEYYGSGGYDQTLIEQWNGTSWSIVTSPNTSTTQNNQLNGVSCASSSDCMAVGLAYTNTLVEQWNGTSWSIVGSVDGVSGTSNYLYGVSCTSTSFCVAAGIFATGGSSYWETLIEEWNGTSWTLNTSPNSSGQNYLQGVSCTSISFCVATGYGQFGTSYWQTLVEEWNGTSWSIVTSPNTSTTENNYLYGVTCVSSSDCWAVGEYVNSGSYYQTLIEQWNGTSWSITTSADTSTTQNNQLQGLTCVSSSDCWAVGAYYTGTNYQTLIEQLAPTTQNNYLQGSSCVSASDCMAVGYYLSNTDQTLVEQWNGTSWTIVTSPNMVPALGEEQNQLLNVNCMSTSSCLAVGAYFNSTDAVEQTLVEEWNGTSWSIVTSPNTSTSQNNYLDAITCISASDCWAVGYYYPGSYAQTLIEQWNGTSWSIVSSPNGNSTQDNKLHGVACASASECWATGWYYTGSVYQLLGEQYNGSSWTLATMANPNTAANSGLYGVTCVSASDCWAAGYINNPNPAPLVEQYNGTSWTSFLPAGLSTTNSNYLYGVTCTSSSECWAVGKYYNGSDEQTLIEEWNGTSWSPDTSPNTSTTENNYLYGVSCASSSDCMAVGYYYTGSYDQTLIEQFAMVCSGGSLGLSTPSSATWPSVTLNGTNQTSTLGLTLVPDDETGTGNGWNIDITSTTFTNANSDTLPTTASTVTGVAGVSAPTGNCSLPTNTITYSPPITVPAGSTAPTAVPIFSANTGTGEGPSDVTLNFAVAVPGYAYSGAYTSTWTFTIANGP